MQKKRSKIFTQLIIVVVLMLLGFSLSLVGSMYLFLGKSTESLLGWGLFTPGLLVGLLCLYLMIKLNWAYQSVALKDLLAHPERILMRFPHHQKKQEVIIGKEALFVGYKHYPFQAPYEKLIELEQQEGFLFFELKVKAAADQYTRVVKIKIPEDQEVELEKTMNYLHHQYLKTE